MLANGPGSDLEHGSTPMDISRQGIPNVSLRVCAKLNRADSFLFDIKIDVHGAKIRGFVHPRNKIPYSRVCAGGQDDMEFVCGGFS